MQHSTGSQGENNQPGEESLWKGFGEKSLLLLSNTSSMDLQMHTKIPEDGYRGTAFCHPLPFVSARGPPPLPWNAPNVSLRPCAAHRLEKPPATSGWWGEAQANPAIAVTMAKCPACSWQGSCYTPASPGAGWQNGRPMAVKQKKHPTARRNEAPD